MLKRIANPKMPDVNVISFVAPWTAFRPKYRLHALPWREMVHLRKKLFEMSFDAGVSARRAPPDHFLLIFAGAKTRFGFPRVGSRIFLTHPLKQPKLASRRYDFPVVAAQALGSSLLFPRDRQIPPACPQFIGC